MATKADLKTTIDLKLDKLFFELEDVTELHETWDEEPDHVQYAEELAWNSCMSTLRLDLDPAYRSGQMTPAQQVRYRELLRKLKEATLLVRKLGFSQQPVSLTP